MKKIFYPIFFLFFFNGCQQNLNLIKRFSSKSDSKKTLKNEVNQELKKIYDTNQYFHKKDYIKKIIISYFKEFNLKNNNFNMFIKNIKISNIINNKILLNIEINIDINKYLKEKELLNTSLMNNDKFIQLLMNLKKKFIEYQILTKLIYISNTLNKKIDFYNKNYLMQLNINFKFKYLNKNYLSFEIIRINRLNQNQIIQQLRNKTQTQILKLLSIIQQFLKKY